nr:NACHT domain-containing protein [Microcoleaceae cyanobacterium MO_207.B10]
MENQITIYLNSGNFQQGFNSITIQLNQNQKLTTTLPAAPQIPHLYKNWQQQYTSLTPTARTGFKKSQITNISSSECFHYYQALCQQLNIWFSPIKNLLPNSEKNLLIINTQNISDYQTREILHKLPWGKITLSENSIVETILSFSDGKNNPNILSEIPRQVRILGILGDNTGINISQDKDLIQKLRRRGAMPKFLPQSNQPLKRTDFAQLWDEAWDVIIFSGHSQTQQKTGIIYLNSQEFLDFQEIRNTLITAKQQGLQLAIFNSCDGLGLAQQLADIGITIIIWREITPDQIAPLFLKYFLTSFTNNNSIYTSMQQARQKLQELHPEIEQKLPGVTQLPMIIHNGKITPPTWSQLRGKTGGRIGGADWNLENLLTRQELRNRKNLLEAVKHEVVARLSQSLHNQMEALINVPKKMEVEKVKRIWDVNVKIGDRPNLKLSPEADIIDVFDDSIVAGRLLILGAPGSGKTTTLLELGQELVIRAQMDVELGIPVFLNLSSWKDDKQSMEEWLVEELRWKYGVSRDIGRRLVRGKQLLPMLDGLDELESSRQGLCVEAINRFLLGEYRPGFLVVCSRLEEYESVGGGLCLNGAVCLLPLSDVQVEGYLLGFGKYELWESVRGDGELLEFVRVPLFLSMVIVAEVSLRRWGELKGDERLDYLLDAYLLRMLERQVDSRFYGGKRVPSGEKTLEWLGWLAYQLEKHSSTEFLIERLRYSWVEKKRERMIYWIVFVALALVSNPIFIYMVFLIHKENQYGIEFYFFVGLGGIVIASLGIFLTPKKMRDEYEKNTWNVETLDFSWGNFKNEFKKQIFYATKTRLKFLYIFFIVVIFLIIGLMI